MLAVDQEAIAVGLLYRQSHSSNNRVLYLGEAGSRLSKKKESLGHGEWLAWLDANHSVLGFGVRAARNLIEGAHWMASNWHLANTLEEIVTNPLASADDLQRADEIRQLIACQFRPTIRGTLGRRRQNEWYTPAPYIALAKAVLGDIDVDPASSALAQETVKARHYFDKEQNGLHQPWYGRIWLNPPYSPPLIGQFIGKLLMEWDALRIASCIALTHNYTDTAWFHDAMATADAVCFTQGRIGFYEPSGVTCKPTQGQAFFYFGQDVDAFKREFGRVGLVVRPEPDFRCRQRVR